MYVELQEQMMEAIRRAVNLETELKPFKEESHKTRTSRNEWQTEITVSGFWSTLSRRAYGFLACIERHGPRVKMSNF